MQQEHQSQKILRSPAFCTMLCHRVLCIFLTTPRSYAAVAFYFGHDEKLLRHGKLATSYIAVEPDGRLQIIHTKGDERDPRLHTQTFHQTAPVMYGPCGPEQARGEGVRAGWLHADAPRAGRHDGDHLCLTRRAVNTPHTSMLSARVAV